MAASEQEEWSVRQQIVEDPVSQLTIQFEVVPDSTARFRLRIFGDLPFGNREFIFDSEGHHAGGGIFVTGACKPTWLCEVDR